MNLSADLKKHLAIAFGLLLTIFVVYGRTLGYPILLFEDQANICQSPGMALPFVDGIKEMLLRSHGGIYTPVTLALWQFVTQIIKTLGGTDCNHWAGALHFFNLLIHFSNSIWVFLILAMWLPLNSEKWAWFGAFFYALHPMNVETVAWISGARDLLTISFGLSALFVFQRHLWILSTILFTCAMLSKPTGVIFPFLAVLMIFRKMSDRTLFYGVVPPLLIGGLLLFVTNILQRDVEIPFQLSLAERPLIYLQSVGFYMMKAVWPLGSVPDYGRSIFALRAMPALFWPAAITIIVMAIALWWRKLEVNFGVDWMILSLLPTSGVLAFPFQQYSVVADRFFSISLVGVAFLFATLLLNFEKKEWTGWAAVVVVSYLGAFTFLANGKWQSDEVLFKNNMIQVPQSRLAYAQLGKAQFAAGKFDQAEPIFRKALEVNPEDGNSWVNLADTLQKLNRKDEAEKLLQQAISKSSATAEVFNDLGVLQFERGHLAGAETNWKKAAQLKKNYFEPRLNLGQLYLKDSRFPEAEKVLAEATRIRPTDEKSRTMLDNVKSRMGR